MTVIERLEKAKEGSRELDAEILRAVKPEFADMALHPHAPGWLMGGDHKQPEYAPAYTQSLDAALTLVADDWWPAFACYDNGRFGAHVWLRGPSNPVASDMKVWGEAHLRPARTDGYKHAIALYPLALCIAALKARMGRG